VAPKRRDVGIPPDSVHTNPVPAQVMHLRKPLRSTPSWLGPPSIQSPLRFSSAIVLLQVSSLLRLCQQCRSQHTVMMRATSEVMFPSRLITSGLGFYSTELRYFPR